MVNALLLGLSKPPWENHRTRLDRASLRAPGRTATEDAVWDAGQFC